MGWVGLCAVGLGVPRIVMFDIGVGKVYVVEGYGDRAFF